MNVLKAYEVHSTTGHLDDSRNQWSSEHLVSVLVPLHFPSDGKGIDLPQEARLSGSRHEGSVVKGPILLGCRHTAWKLELAQKVVAPKEGWCSVASRAGFVRGPPASHLPTAPPSSACLAWCFSLPFDSGNSPALLWDIPSTPSWSCSLSWPVLLPATCKQGTLMVKAATLTDGCSQRKMDRRVTIKKINPLGHLLIYCRTKGGQWGNEPLICLQLPALKKSPFFFLW